MTKTIIHIHVSPERSGKLIPPRITRGFPVFSPRVRVAILLVARGDVGKISIFRTKGFVNRRTIGSREGDAVAARRPRAAAINGR